MSGCLDVGSRGGTSRYVCDGWKLVLCLGVLVLGHDVGTRGGTSRHICISRHGGSYVWVCGVKILLISCQMMMKFLIKEKKNYSNEKKNDCWDTYLIKMCNFGLQRKTHKKNRYKIAWKLKSHPKPIWKATKAQTDYLAPC